MVYLVDWLSYGLWRVMRRDALGDPWPELRTAWEEACRTQERAHVNPVETPLFLVLGPLTRELQGLLESFGAHPAARRSYSPLQVFNHPEAMFVACGNLSHLGRHGEVSRQRDETEPRLRYLCQLLMRDRSARLPIQGIVVAMPFAATQAHAELHDVILACQDDLHVIRQATGLEVPLFLAFHGLETMPTQLAALPECLQRFPPLPDLDPAEIVAMYREGVDQFCLEQLPGQLRSLLNLCPTPPSAGENIRLYRWLSAVATWRTRLQQLILEGTRNEFSEPGMVAGCYLWATPPAKSATAHALWADLLAHQHIAARISV
jgi:hypothetical protein